MPLRIWMLKIWRVPLFRVWYSDSTARTMQKALSELEKTGLVYSQRTSGRFITEDTNMIEELKQKLAAEKIDEFFVAMKMLGISKEETIQLIQQHN